MFVALITGSALRPNAAAAALPEPAAWSAAAAGAHAGPMQDRTPALDRAAAAVSRSSAPANKTNTKPFHSAWMTKEWPPTWNRLSPQSVLTPAPASFTPIGCAPVGAPARAPAAMPSDRDIATRICVARR
ncbi:hypothetical protein [Mycobacterium sp. M23085]|uniref:hypothetical protein n=1 Tax=Mycobacterium sp. M23085 TaxID=3378087 RepID=UPI003877CDD2